MSEFSPEEEAAIARDEAGIYRLSNDEIGAINDTGIWPVHPDPRVVVVRKVVRIADGSFVRWYRRQPPASGKA
jgi:hypothetical protein